jgi:acetyl-CoA C-acetyltransferase
MKIGILGVGQTKFGEHWNKSLKDLLAESQFAAIEDANNTGAKISVDQIDEIFTGNMCSKIFSNQSNLGSMASEILNVNVPSTVVESACASGGLAIYSAIRAIESGRAEIVLVNGVEKMTDVDSFTVTTGLAGACDEHEQFNGATFPGLCAMIARLYMEKYGLTREELALVSVKNHENGFLNEYAHFRKKITIKDVVNSPMIADPLTLLDCSPVSDGAASIILCSEEFLASISPLGGDMPCIIGSGFATDTVSICARDNLIEWKATQIAAKKAYEMAKIKPGNVDFVELHDGFSIVQLLAIEDLGFCKKGNALKIIEEKNFINLSGGLKSRGHPVGATGVAQAVDIVRQLRKNGGIGLTHNVGGAGSSVLVHVYE